MATGIPDETKRLIIKTGSGIATSPPSSDHRNGDWIATSIYDAELYMDTVTGKIYTANGGTVQEVITSLNSLGDLSDVDLTGLISGDILQYDGADFVPIALPSSNNLGNSDLTSTDAVRVFTLAGSSATDNLTIERGDGTDLVQFKGNMQILFGGVSFKQGSTGNYDWTLGGALSTDSFTIQTSAGNDIAEFRGDQATQFSGIVGVGSAPNTNQPLYVFSNTHSRTIYSLNQTANGTAVYANSLVNNNSIAVKAFANQAGGTGYRYGLDVQASGGSANYAIYLRGGDISFADATNGHKIGVTTSEKLSFWGTTPIVQPSALTTQLTDLSGDVTPTTPDYVLTATSGGWGCGSQDEFETMTSVILNLQTRVQELEDALSSSAGGVGLIA